MYVIQWFRVIIAADNKWRLPMGRKYPSVVRDTNRRLNDLEKSRKPPTSDMSRRMLNVLYATSAGFCSSSAGTFGKIGMGVDEFFGIDNQVRAQTAFCNSSHVAFFFSAQAFYSYFARFIMVTMVVLANIGVWLLYTKSLRFGSTLTSTGISIASNYIFTVGKLYTDVATPHIPIIHIKTNKT